jgi:hypothetical protein
MIRHPVPRADLELLIAAEKPAWLARAEARTTELRSAGRWDDGKKHWSEIKDVYRRLQHDKCAFCERRLAGPPYGAVDHDVEHFRPKAAVKAWPPARYRGKKLSYGFDTGGDWSEGYYLLAFHPWNYVTACKVCNSALKRSFFPVGAKRISKAEDPWQMGSERPFLVYPLGDLDEDPEKLITFAATLPVPRVKSGPRFRRASVIIDFFRLDIREELLWERSDRIVSLFMALRLAETGSPSERALAGRSIAQHVSPFSPHTSCSRAFLSLYREDPGEAEKIADECQEYLDSHSQPN